MQSPTRKQLALLDFLQASKRMSTNVVTNATLDENRSYTWELPKQGLYQYAMLNLRGKFTITAATSVTGGKWKWFPNPAPMGILKQILVDNSAGTIYKNYSGFMAYLAEYLGYGNDAMAWNGSRFGQNTAQLFGQNYREIASAPNGLMLGSIPTGGAGTYNYNFNFTIPIRFAFERSGMYGMVVGAQSNVVHRLNISTGKIVTGLTTAGGSNDLVEGLTGVGMTYSFTLGATIDMFHRNLPDRAQWDYDYLLNTMYAETSTSQSLILGSNTVQVPANDLITGICHAVTNNGAAAGSTQISNLQLSYGSNQLFRGESYDSHIAELYFGGKNLSMPNGCIYYDFSNDMGILGDRNISGAFDNTYQADFKSRFDFADVGGLGSASNTGIETLTQSIRAISQV